MEKATLVAPYRELATNALFANGGAFAAHEIDISMIYTGAGEPVVRGMLDGRGDYTHVCAAPVPAAVAGRGLKILGAFQTSSFGLYAHPSIKRLKQLRGKTITLTGSITRPALETALRRHGCSLDDVKIARPGGDRDSASPRRPFSAHERVLNGTVDAISANAPQSQAAQRAGLQCLLRFGDVYPIPTCALLATERVLREDREQVVRFMHGLLDSIDDFIRDRGLGMQLLSDLGMPADLVEGTYWETRGYLRPDGHLPDDVQRLWIAWSKEELSLTEDVPPGRVFDFSVLDEVIAHR